PDTVTITDGASLATGTVSLSTGDDMDAIVDKFNALFASKSMQLTASNVGGQLSITSDSYGSAAKFNLNFDSGTNVASQLGLSTGQIAGTDVVGTIDGVAAVGSGQTLTGASGSDVEGIALQYAGTAPYTGQVTHTVGLAAQMNNIANSETETGDGLIASITTSLQSEITSLTSKQSEVQEQITTHQTALTQQFTAMETAIATLQTQAASLTSQISGLQTSGA
ncbi:MAG TPA: flagellar filament capping protein FliD, partial [Gemmatimonadaceae bacterium]|nr:flagellar filament capping protein FliD [Gemmatimonadaceae bacterium]